METASLRKPLRKPTNHQQTRKKNKMKAQLHVCIYLQLKGCT